MLQIDVPFFLSFDPFGQRQLIFSDTLLLLIVAIVRSIIIAFTVTVAGGGTAGRFVTGAAGGLWSRSKIALWTLFCDCRRRRRIESSSLLLSLLLAASMVNNAQAFSSSK